jgi:hypothetical protein
MNPDICKSPTKIKRKENILLAIKNFIIKIKNLSLLFLKQYRKNSVHFNCPLEEKGALFRFCGKYSISEKSRVEKKGCLFFLPF